MTKRNVSIMFFICFLTSVVSGCGAEYSVSFDSVFDIERVETINNLITGIIVGTSDKVSKIETADTEQNENSDIIVTSSGMPLRDETVLYVIRTKYYNNGFDGHLWEENEYDIEGHILRSYMGNTRLDWEYDDFGNLTRNTCYESLDEIRYSYECKNVYDDGKLISQIKYNSSGDIITEAVYDNDGKLIKDINYRRDGTIETECNYGYDAAGNITLKASYDADGNIEVYEGYDCDTYNIIPQYWTYKNEYDDLGNLIKYAKYDYEGNILEFTEYAYDNVGNLTKEIYYDYEYDYESITEYTYGDNGNLLKEINYQYDFWDFREEYDYDEENRLIKYTLYDKGEIYYWMEYEYIAINI